MQQAGNRREAIEMSTQQVKTKRCLKQGKRRSHKAWRISCRMYTASRFIQNTRRSHL